MVTTTPSAARTLKGERAILRGERRGVEREEPKGKGDNEKGDSGLTPSMRYLQYRHQQWSTQ
eukprot:scaffold928_cov370-Prasinococcus_capsulatus_cf.AAC.21